MKKRAFIASLFSPFLALLPKAKAPVRPWKVFSGPCVVVAGAGGAGWDAGVDGGQFIDVITDSRGGSWIVTGTQPHWKDFQWTTLPSEIKGKWKE